MGRRGFLGILGTIGMGASLAMTTPGSTRAGKPFYLGGYSTDGGKGIVLAEDKAGALSQHDVLAASNPSWLARAGNRLYAVDESSPAGAVTALAIDDPWQPKILNSQPSEGDSPTHCCVHGDHVVSSNYGSGSIVVHPIRQDGSLDAPSDLVQHGTGAHAHQAIADPTGRWLLAVDIGIDTVFVYQLQMGKLTEHTRCVLPKGSGPRHLHFHPNGRIAYLAHEYQSTVTVLAWNPTEGVLTAGQVVGTRPEGNTGENYPAEAEASPDGRFVYVSNRGDDTLTRFTVTGDTLQFVDAVPVGGDWPRHFTLHGDYAYVANQRSDTVTWLHRDPASGALSAPLGSLAVPAASMVFPYDG